MNKDTRYQYQNIFVKIARRIRYQIPHLAKAVYRFPINCFYYFTREDWTHPCLCFKITAISWEIDAEWYHYEEELFEILGLDKDEIEELSKTVEVE